MTSVTDSQCRRLVHSLLGPVTLYAITYCRQVRLLQAQSCQSADLSTRTICGTHCSCQDARADTMYMMIP